MYKNEYIKYFNSTNKELLEELLCDYSDNVDYSLEDFNSAVEFYINSLI